MRQIDVSLGVGGCRKEEMEVGELRKQRWKRIQTHRDEHGWRVEGGQCVIMQLRVGSSRGGRGGGGREGNDNRRETGDK